MDDCADLNEDTAVDSCSVCILITMRSILLKMSMLPFALVVATLTYHIIMKRHAMI